MVALSPHSEQLHSFLHDIGVDGSVEGSAFSPALRYHIWIALGIPSAVPAPEWDFRRSDSVYRRCHTKNSASPAIAWPNLMLWAGAFLSYLLSGGWKPGRFDPPGRSFHATISMSHGIRGHERLLTVLHGWWTNLLGVSI